MKPVRHVLLLAIWLLLVGGGFSMILQYSFTPGKTVAASDDWPGGSKLRRSPDRPQLVMFVHPVCPCSRASLAELERFVVRTGGRADVRVVFKEPAGMTREWQDSSLWRTASGIPGIALVRDEGGVETGIFHAAVSGETFLYDSGGRLVFHGGITDSRGHEGDNAGLSAIEEIVNTGSSALGRTPVFGCPLYSSAIAASK
jgi:hypothetical protein